MSESRETALRRLGLRSMRRGIREMDLILQAFAQTGLPALADDDIARYDALLSENDHDLYAWITGQAAPPPQFAPLIALIADGAVGLTRR